MKSLRTRFWEKVADGPDCWEWIGARYGSGYGKLVLGGRKNRHEKKAHRLSWELHFGPIPDGMQVCHHCDNPPCVRLGHLFLGTAKDNSADMVRKGRNASTQGERNGNAILSAEKVAMARKFKAAGFSSRKIAALIGISKSQVHRIIKGQNWTVV